MAWNTPKTWVGGEVPTAALLNQQLRDNMELTMPGIATQEGQIFVGNGPNSIAARLPDAARVNTSESTAATSYGDNLATVGPSVTITNHGKTCIVVWSCSVQNNTDNADSFMSWRADGDNTLISDDAKSLRQDGVLAGNQWRFGGVDVNTVLTPGTTTFKAQYRVNSGTATFGDRFIGVIPL